jgi:hypothetical protein
MEQLKTVGEQVIEALDGRTKRWLCWETRIGEPEMSKKISGKLDFTIEEIEKINARLKVNIVLPMATK